MFSIPAVAMCIPAGMISMPACMTGNQIQAGDTGNFYFTYTNEFLTCKNKILQRSEFPHTRQIFALWAPFFITIIVVWPRVN